MKKIVFAFLVFVFLPAFSYAGIPISEQVTEPVKEEVKKDEPVVKKKKVRKNFFKKIIKKLKRDEGGASGSSLFNWLSFGAGVLAFVGLIAGSIFLAVPMSIAAIVFGILGLKKKQRMKGLGIAGLILGGTFVVLVLLLVVILAAWLWNE